MIDFIVPGVPKGKGRPKFNRATGRAYTPAKTVQAEGDVLGAWDRAGAVRLPDEALWLNYMVVLERPKGHWKRDGTLSAAGLRSPWPMKKPDIDNVEKLICDALQGAAYRDDAAIVHVVSWKRWANPGEVNHLWVRLSPMSRHNFP